jgi:hypothetical protein
VDKVFISKNDLEKALVNTKGKAGPLTTIIAWFGFICTILWAIPLIVFWILLLVFCIPFFLIDNHILRRLK